MLKNTHTHPVTHTQQAIHINERRDQHHLLLSSTKLLPFSYVQQRTETYHAWAHTNTHTHEAHEQNCSVVVLLLPTLFTHKLAMTATNGSEGWRVPPAVSPEPEVGPPGAGHSTALSLHQQRLSWRWRGGRYHTAIARVTKSQATSTVREREWQRKTKYRYEDWPGEEVRAKKLQQRG